MKILWHTKLGEAHSWCYVVHDLINAMLEIGGHEIHCKSTDNLDHLPNNLKSHLIKGYHGNLLNGPADFLSDNGLIKVHPNTPLKEIPDINAPYDLELAYTIFYQFCRRFKQESRCRAAIWNFESSILPPGWDQYHRAIDYILPSSQFSYDIFAQNGVPKDKMLVVPHGINTEIFNPSIPPFKLKTQKRVKFLHVARAHARKLHDRVIKGYLDAFTGDDDVCLVLKTEFKKPDKDKVFEVDVKEILENAHKGRKNPAEIEVILEHVPFIGSLYTACDTVVSMSSTEGFCLLPGTPVDTNSEIPKTIENIQIGDFVYSHLGNLKQVVNTTNRYVNEKLIKIRRRGNDEYFCGTKDHPQLIVKRSNKNFGCLRKDAKNNTLDIKWIGLSNIEKGDLVVIPKPKFSYKYVEKYDMSKYSNNVCGDKVWLSSSFDKRTGRSSLTSIASILNCSFQHVSDTLNNKVQNINTELCKKILKIASDVKYTKPEPIKIDKFISIDEEFAKFIGIYIAEGCVGKKHGYFNITMHIDETYGHNIVRNICKKYNIPYKEVKRDRKYDLYASSKIFARFLSSEFGEGVYNKKIPYNLYNSPYIKDILHGIFYGDGCSSGRYSFNTSSIRLKNDIYTILLKNNILCHLHTDKRQEKDNYTLYIPSSLNERFYNFITPYKYKTKVNILSEVRNNSIIECNDYFLVPIIDVQTFDYCGKVCNIEVEDDKSFCSFGMATHNCLPLLESLACEKPIIAPRYGGPLEFLNDSNALLVNTKEMYAPASHQYWVASNKAVVGDPDIEHYKQLLRYLYENLEYETNRIKEAAKTTVEKFSWKNAAQMILDLPIPKISKRFHNKRKVAYIIPYAMVGGGEIWVKNVIKTLDENYESHAILVNGSNDLFKESLRKLNVIVEDLSYLPEQERGPALKCLIEAENYSIVHFYNSFGIYNVIKNAWQQGFRARVVETVHSDLKWPDSMSKISKRDNFVSAIATISKKQAEILAKANNKNIMFLPQQVEWERFKLPRNKDVLHKLNIKTDFVVGFVGRISPEKNTPLILQCAKQLPDVSFVIIGDGPQENALKQLGKSIKNIHFLGFRNDVELFYPTFDVLLITSTIEGIALVSLEAMTAGTPVISTNVGAMGEVVNNTNGFLLSSNAQLFINAIATLKTNKDLHKTLINGSYETSKKYEQLGAEININKLYNSLF